MSSISAQLQRNIGIALLGLGLSSCAIGPDFQQPTAPTAKSYTEKPLSTETASVIGTGPAGQAQQFMNGQDIPAQWWTLFRSPELDNLIKVGLNNSPNLVAAKARLRQAQENLNAQVGSAVLPTVDASFSPQREREVDAINQTTQTFTLYNASVNISYTLDIFGGSRRAAEALASQVDYEKFQMEAAYLTLTSNIVTTAVTVASLQAQIQASNNLIRAQQEQLAIVQKQFNLGGVSNADVLTQQTQLAQTRATLPTLEKNLAQTRHALAVLVGAFPSEIQLPTFELNKFELPTQLPVSLPSVLVRQRPDVRAAEALLHKASAEVGVASANLLPKFTLTGSYGFSSNKTSTLFDNTSVLWSLGGQVLQPIFRGGSLQAQRRSAVAAYDEAAANYKKTVLQAFQNVADSLRALETDAQALRAQKQAENAAQNALALTQKQYRLGSVSYLNLLNAQRQYQQTRINRIQAQAARYTDTAALFQALGGGWWNRTNGENHA